MISSCCLIGVLSLTPVMLFPGLFSALINPASTGYVIPPMIIGLSLVAFDSDKVAGVVIPTKISLLSVTNF